MLLLGCAGPRFLISRFACLLAWVRWRHRLEDEDRAWDWSSIYAESSESDGGHECYAAWADDELQGLMALHLRHPNAQEGRFIMVDYLSTNPANRSPQGGLKYVGTALMALAIIRSEELGFDGRICLEALPGAETFYQGLGMIKQPEKSPDGNAVYLLEREPAKELLEEIQKKGILKL